MDVLISGASMAGLSAAYWFARLGHRVTVVERSPGLRRGGAPIDVRGDALGVAERMGILGEVAAQRVELVPPMPVLDGRGRQVATLDLTWFANETDDDIEISRDRLNAILLRAVGTAAHFRFDTSIVSIVDGPDGAEVTLTNGESARFDLVVGADGLHSQVRRLAFGPESDFVHHIGYYVALVDLDPQRSWERGMLSVPGLTVAGRDTGDVPQAMMLVRSPELVYRYDDHAAQRRLVGDFLAGLDAWEVPAIRKQFLAPTSAGFYFDSVSQTRMPSWVNGHVAVIGDAGHCAGLLSGMGTSLAILAAELLATIWTDAGGDLTAAGPTYDARLRPYVDKAQEFVGRGGSIMVPATQADLDQRNQMFCDAAAAHAAD